MSHIAIGYLAPYISYIKGSLWNLLISILGLENVEIDNGVSM